MGKHKKNNLFAINMSYRLPILKNIYIQRLIKTNIITAVMSIIISIPKNMFIVSKQFESHVFSKIRRLCGPVTFANDDIMAWQWKMLLVV